MSKPKGYFVAPEYEKDYCKRCWIEFTTLTEEEYNTIYGAKKSKNYQRDSLIFCETNGKYYTSQKDIANDFKISECYVSRIINGKHKSYKYSFRYVT